jgi:hypothetical protein
MHVRSGQAIYLMNLQQLASEYPILMAGRNREKPAKKASRWLTKRLPVRLTGGRIQQNQAIAGIG